jgi:hypothetical protein
MIHPLNDSLVKVGLQEIFSGGVHRTNGSICSEEFTGVNSEFIFSFEEFSKE